MIYFAQDSGTFEIKIGHTGSAAEARVKALQTGNPRPIKILAVIEGAASDEADLHRRFAPHRVAGEWFRPVPELLAFLLALPHPAPAATVRRRLPWPLKVYLAGKIAKSDWRHDLFQTHAALNLWDGDDDSNPPPWPVAQGCLREGHSYVGPYYFAVSEWHASGWTPNSHLNTAGITELVEIHPEDHSREPDWVSHGSGAGYRIEYGAPLNDRRRDLIRRRCLAAVATSDLVFAWIDSPDCYGTVAELGMAAALGKLICVAGPQAYPDMWLACSCAAWSGFHFLERADGGHIHAYHAAVEFAAGLREYEAEADQMFPRLPEVVIP
jgi:hypothetical protein